MKVTGASSFGGNMTLSLNQNGSTGITISNTTAGSSAGSQLTLTSTSSSYVGKASSSYSGFRTIAASDMYILNQTAGDIAIHNDFASGNIKFAVGNTTTAQMTLTSVGSLGIGATSVNASAITQIDSTTKGFLPPRMTTTQKNAISSPAAGLVVYDTTLNKLCVYTTAWETITSI
jgi:hypothetical protein